MARLALLSTSDKTGLFPFAQRLVDEFGFTLISSGGTATLLQAAGLTVTKVADYTGAPEILGGRVKTLHPRVHGGILARRSFEADLADLATHGIEAIDLVVVNLYPFEQTIQAQLQQGIANTGMALAEAVEQIDIGGPAMLRAAAKNFAHVTVLCDPSQYDECLQELQDHQGDTTLAFRQACALQVFACTTAYDHAIATYLSKQVNPSQSASQSESPFWVSGQPLQVLRYGENPHQGATWYQTAGSAPQGWAAATQLQGKALSYNNLVDLEAARQLIAEFAGCEEAPTAAILKHNNPCGVAQADTLVQAYQRALAADSLSAFGGIVACNRSLDAATAEMLIQTFLECVVVPDCEPEAKEILRAKSNLRVLVLPDVAQGPEITIKAIAGGWLTQTADTVLTPPSDWQMVTQILPTAAQLADMVFAWKVVKHVKSNAIVVAKAGTTLGIGAGQMNRVGAVNLALAQAGNLAQGATLASDGFFPFDDSVRAAAAAGITTIVQPGGSLRDGDSIEAANQLELVMAMTHTRHFLH
jgi:phosphoribosylaminoimidazolecarboxamide formyltransferase/IMP cyclohydrolase